MGSRRLTITSPSCPSFAIERLADCVRGHPLDGGDDVVRCVPLYRDLRVGCARQRCVAGGLLPSTPQWRTMTAAQSNASRIASAARMYAAMSSVLAGRQSQVVDRA
jgi:hypothetical protein